MNNLDLIRPLLKFDSPDEFYHVQVLKRKKENPELGRNAKLIKTYYIDSLERLEDEFGEIQVLCTYHDARCYINLNRRSFKKVAKHLTVKIPFMVTLNREYYSLKTVYESVCGGVQEDKPGGPSFGGILAEPKESRVWVVDIDVKNQVEVVDIGSIINQCPPVVQNKIIATIPTKNGFHLLTKGFHVEKFKETCQYYIDEGRITEIPDIQKNNPTLLYSKA